MAEISLAPNSFEEKNDKPKQEAKPERTTEKASFILKLAKKLNWNQGIFLDKTRFCKHDFGCLENIISGTASAFLMAYKINTGINVITLGILKRKFKELFFSLWSKDSLTWVGYLSAYTLVLKIVTCLLRRLRDKGDPYNDLLAGAAAGATACLLLQKEQRLVWVGYLLARTCDAYYNHLVNRGVVNKSKWHYVFVYGFVYALYGYCIMAEPDIMPKSIRKFFDTFFNKVFTPNFKLLGEIWRDKKKLELIKHYNVYI